jgi:hypothetical protein
MRDEPGIIHRLAHGSVEVFLMLLWSTPGCQVLNTAISAVPLLYNG